MRMDVKFGFAIGFVLLAVLIVYVLVINNGGNANKGAELATDGPTAPVTVAPDLPGPAVTPNDPTHLGVAPAGPATQPSVAAVDPFAGGASPATQPSSAVATGNGGDVWNAALTTGQLPTLAVQAPRSAHTGMPAVEPAHATATLTADAVPAATSPATTGMPGGRTHVVARGETLSSISQAAYGIKSHWAEIAKANPSVNPNKLKVGATLTLPEIKSAAKPEATTPAGDAKKAADVKPVSDVVAADGKTYKVQAGDSLQRIAVKLYGKRDMWQKIYDANKEAIGSDPAKLKLNSVLKLPQAPTQTASR